MTRASASYQKTVSMSLKIYAPKGLTLLSSILQTQMNQAEDTCADAGLKRKPSADAVRSALLLTRATKCSPAISTLSTPRARRQQDSMSQLSPSSATKIINISMNPLISQLLSSQPPTNPLYQTSCV